MHVNIPAEVVAERFLKDLRRPRDGHHRVVLEAVAADVVEQPLELRHVGHRPGAEGVEPVVGESALADISPNPSLGVGRGHPAEGKRPRRRPAFERSVGVFHAERAAEDRRRGDADVGQEALRPVAAVKQRALVVVVAVVVVPIDEGGGRLRGELHRMHRQHARHVNLAGTRHESLAHHAHQGADVAAE